MGAAEVGREAGDAGGPLLVGGIAAAATLPIGLLALAGVLAAATVSSAFRRSEGDQQDPAGIGRTLEV